MSAFAFLLASFTSIFTVVNPFSAMPIFLALTQDDPPERRMNQLLKACIYMTLILFIFFAAGTYIMSFFGITIQGIRIAGGLMIMQASYSLLNPKQAGRKLTDEDVDAAREKEDISFSPLAMPLLSGPGSIAVVLGLSSTATGWQDYGIIVIAIIITALIAYIILRLSPYVVKFLGKSGMTALTRMMGFIGLCIGVQFIINGVIPLMKLA